jgi:hypothetical protein
MPRRIPSLYHGVTENFFFGGFSMVLWLCGRWATSLRARTLWSALTAIGRAKFASFCYLLGFILVNGIMFSVKER